jgi:hypothetical protein
MLILFLAIQEKETCKSFYAFTYILVYWSMSSILMKLQVYPGEHFWNKKMVGALCCIPLLYLRLLFGFCRSYEF